MRGRRWMPARALTLSPRYDVLCTLHYGIDGLAMYIDNVHRINRVTTLRIVNEAVRWGMARRRAGEIVTDVLARSAEAIHAARDETEGLPDDILTTVTAQLQHLTSDKHR